LGQMKKGRGRLLEYGNLVGGHQKKRFGSKKGEGVLGLVKKKKGNSTG